ncbi:MAG: hypothetical protein LUQ59_10955 [Methanothrix sp.]|nr:hypothetical protein [Methanothrix sp.]
MLKKGTAILMLAAVLVLAGEVLGNAQNDVTYIPASEDVYLSMGTDRVTVFNQSDILLCAVNVSETNGTLDISDPGCPVIQFDISGQNITEDDMAVMLLKAKSVLTQGDPVMVVMMSIGSDWDESSDYTTFLVNILPAWKIISEKDATAMNSNTDGDLVFAFDVSKKLSDALAKGENVSFLLQANSNSSSEISFLSRESGEGPCLVIMPYPRPLENLSQDEAFDAAIVLPENAGNTSLSEQDAAEPSIAEAGQMKSNLSADETHALLIATGKNPEALIFSAFSS